MLRLLRRLLRLQNHGPVFFLDDYAGFFNLLLLLFVRLRVVPPLMMMKMLPRRGGGGQKRRHQRETTSTITLRRRQNARCSHHHRRRCRTTRRHRHHHHLFSLSLSLTRETLRKRARTLYTYKIPTSGENEKILGEKKLFSFCCKKDWTQEFVARVEKEQKRVFTTAAERESENYSEQSHFERVKWKGEKEKSSFAFFWLFFERREQLFYHRREQKSKKKSRRFFTWERRAHKRKVFSYTHRQILLFEASGWNRESSRKRAVFSLEKEQSFFTRKRTQRKVEKSSRKHTDRDFNRREVASFKKMSSFLSLQI